MRFDGTSIHSLLNIKRADEWKLENRAEGYKNMKGHLDDTSKAPTAVACICPKVRQKIQLLYVQSVAFNAIDGFDTLADSLSHGSHDIDDK